MKAWQDLRDMNLNCKIFKATFSANFNFWRVDLGEFSFWIRYLKVARIKNVKLKYQTIKAEDVDLELIGEWLILHSWSKIYKKYLYTPYDPDRPRNLAKSVTVK